MDYFQQPALLKRFVKHSFIRWSVDCKQVSDAERERLVANTAYFAAGEPDNFAQIKRVLRQVITEPGMDSEPDGGS